MNAGPGGFAHAPVTKGLVLAAVGSTVLANAARASHRRLPGPLLAASAPLACGSPGELLLACLLLYYFRVIERQSGSSSFGSYALVVAGLSSALQLALSGALLPGRGGAAASAAAAAAIAPVPVQLAFASLVRFAADVPASSGFTVMGVAASDKAVVYIAGLQLLLVAGGRRGLLALAASALAALAYRANVLGLRRLRLPGFVARGVAKLLGPLLCDERSSGPSILIVTSGAGGAAAAAAGEGGAGAAAAAAAAAAAFGGGGGGPPQRPGGVGAFGDGFLDGALGPGSSDGGGGGGGARRRGSAGGGAGPPPPPPVEPSPEALATLESMGFAQERAAAALRQTGNDVQAAIALLVG